MSDCKNKWQEGLVRTYWRSRLKSHTRPWNIDVVIVGRLLEWGGVRSYSGTVSSEHWQRPL
jgi:hypothetical protein